MSRSQSTARSRGRAAVICTAFVLGLTSLLGAPSRADSSVGGLSGAESVERAPTPPVGQVALAWAPLYMTDEHDYSEGDALDLASNFDLVIAMPVALQSYSARMMAANPQLTLLAYASGTQLKKEESGGLPETAFAHDRLGNRIIVRAWGNYLMQPSSAVWRDASRAECNDRSALGGFQGCLVDSTGLGVFTENTLTTLPADPVTHVTYSEEQWRDQMGNLAAYFEQQDPSVIHVYNAVQNSYRYWRAPVTTRPLIATMPAAQMEDFLRGAENPTDAFPSPENWKRNVDVINDFEARGQVGLFTTKLWSNASEAQVAQWEKYAMASYLMGAGGKSYFAFTRSRDKAGAMQANVPYRLPREIGTPLGAMAQRSDGSWTRTFTNGMSAVNPTASTVTINLPAPMRDLSGNVVSSVKLPPNTGEVLILRAQASGVPTVKIRKVTVRKNVLVRGVATDDVQLKKVGVAVRSKARHAWLSPRGTWGHHRRYIKAKLKKPGQTRSNWVLVLRLPPGSYKLVARAWDAAGVTSVKPFPHMKFRVRQK